MQETSSCVLKPKGLDIGQVLEEIPLRDLKIPEEARYRVPTMNRHGYMFTKFDTTYLLEMQQFFAATFKNVNFIEAPNSSRKQKKQKL